MADEHLDIDLTEYATQLQQAVRESGGLGSARWRLLIERGLSTAYRQGDIVGLCDVVQAIVSLLDAQGRQRDAVAEVEHAISLAKGEPNALAMLLSMRATFQATAGDAVDALQAIEAAEAQLPRATLAFAATKCAYNCLVARCLILDPSVAVPEHLSISPGTDARTSDSLFLLSVFIPYAFSLGRGPEMHAWTRMLRLEAESIKHDYRIGDAAVFGAAEAATRSLAALPDDRALPRWNWLARWRLGVLQFRQQLLRRDWAGARDALAALVKARRRAGQASLDTLDGFEALCHAQLETGEEANLATDPPSSLHLLNLPSCLAMAEGIATSGTRTSAGQWRDWLEAVPEHIVTSLEWPVSRHRLQALLTLRCGDVRGARKHLERSVAWAAASGYPLEQATAEVQLTELLRYGSGGGSGPPSRAWRRESSVVLRAEGVVR